MGLLDLEELCHGLIEALHEVIPVDMVAISEVPADLPHTISISVPPVPEEMHVAFARHAGENPLVRRYAETRDGRAFRFSDVITRRELHRLEIYREVYRPLGVEYQIAFTLPGNGERVLSRGARDFSASNRDLLNMARPYLIQAYRNAVDHTRLARAAPPPGITASGISIDYVTAKEKLLESAPHWSQAQAARALRASEGGVDERGDLRSQTHALAEQAEERLQAREHAAGETW